MYAHARARPARAQQGVGGGGPSSSAVGGRRRRPPRYYAGGGRAPRACLLAAMLACGRQACAVYTRVCSGMARLCRHCPVAGWVVAVLLPSLLIVAQQPAPPPPPPPVHGRGRCGRHVSNGQALLKELEMGSCMTLEYTGHLSDAEIAALADRLRSKGHAALREVTLSGVPLSDTGMVLLAPAFGTIARRGGSKFQLHGTELSDQGAIILCSALYRAMRDLSPAEIHGPGITLDVSENKLGDDAAKALGKVLPFMWWLDVSDNDIGDGGALALLAELPRSPMGSLRIERNAVGRDTMLQLYAAYNREGALIDTDGSGQRAPSASRTSVLQAKVERLQQQVLSPLSVLSTWFSALRPRCGACARW